MKTVVALGTFDGVHLGHQRIIKDAVSYAKRHGLTTTVTTFDPHPQQFIVPERGLKLLTTLFERKSLLKNLGVNNVKIFKFNAKLQKLNYEKFVSQYLVKGLNAAVVFVGYDYAFGHGRSGGISELRKLGRKYGFIVKVVRPYKFDGHIVKSSMIRNLISSGDFKKALRLLGHPYQITGKVIKGRGVGRGLGFPTANLEIDKHKLIPSQGVYFAKTLNRKSLVNIGSRPTFGVGICEVEVHIPKFHKNLYNKVVSVDIISRLRDEKQFSDALELIAQIKRDVAKVQAFVI